MGAIRPCGTISRNKVAATYFYDAVDVCGASNTQVSNNTIDGAAESAIHLDGTCGPAPTNEKVNGNHVNGACAAVLNGAGATGTINDPTPLNVANVELSGDVCPAGSDASVHVGRRTASVFRPHHKR